ncbi:MAG: bifunctional NAD(P)H-hydrate repair enzyme Nnr [Nitrospirales bacterium]|nr:MAG: bifunctional NAD(P)H-hydrate repair enzyme Nnr [Nitrospirales bacterium]
MERAGMGVVQVLEQQLGSPSGQPITIVCGKGNNGGDGLVIARLLKQKRAKIQVLLLAHPKELTQDALGMYTRLRKIAPSSIINVEPSAATIQASIQSAALLIDAMLGTGLSAPVREPYRTAITRMNEAQTPTLAVDIPSGIHSDTGEVMGIAIKAQTTVTFGCPKIGLYLGKGINHTGIIATVDIGIPEAYVKDLGSSLHLLNQESLAALLPGRAQDSHKGTCGHIGLIAGSPGKTGSAALAARAALRTGAGLVTIATPQSGQLSLDAKLFEAMTLAMPETKAQTLSRAALKPLTAFAKERDVIALGPGISTHTETGKLIRQLLPCLKQHCVIDADGLNILAGHLSILSSCKSFPIITPHPGEMARLLGQTSAKTVNQNRLGIALKFAKAHKVILVLKGARTIVAHPSGQAAICTTGNPGMASAGMGDALTGVIVSFLAQGLSPWDAARTGVCLHGLAGDLAAKRVGQAGLIASDLIEYLPRALQSIASGCDESILT